MMHPESQVLVREFNRRLRAALRQAPNHVRMEAALEVESHVLDVLARHPGTAPEHEQVAQILAGFGTPEAYAMAVMNQMPGAMASSVRSSSKEILLAMADLTRGGGHLLVACTRQGIALLGWAFGQLRRASVLLLAGGRQLQSASRAPLSRMGQRLRSLGSWSRRTGRATLRAARWTLQRSRSLMTFLQRTARSLVRLALLLLLGGGALAAFALALFATLAPDVAGWGVHELDTELQAMLAELRSHTVAVYDTTSQTTFSATGHWVVAGALAGGLALVGAVVLIVLLGRRRNRTVRS